MKIPKLKKFTLVEILWDDSSQASTSTWFTNQQYIDFRDDTLYYKSIGYFLEVKHNSIFLCGSFCAYEKSNEINQTSKLESIPLGCIKSLKKLK